MVRRRLLALVTLLVTLVSVRVTVAAPVESAAVLRALGCCATHCGGTPAGRAARCCEVRQGAADPAVAGEAPVVHGAAVGAGVPLAPGDVGFLAGPAVIGRRSPISLPNPLYLRVQSLRL
jgi:hypothetical protein